MSASKTTIIEKIGRIRQDGKRASSTATQGAIIREKHISKKNSDKPSDQKFKKLETNTNQYNT